MSKIKKPKKKLKNSLNHSIQKIFLKSPSSSFNHKQVCSLLNIKEGALRKLTYSVLEGLVEEDFLKRDGYGVYSLSSDSVLISGTLEITTRGSGYVLINNKKGPDDIFIPSNQLNQSLNGDVVRVQITKKGSKKTEGRIVEVLERERTQFVGTIQLHGHFAFFIPDNERMGTDIFISSDNLNGAKDGDKALVRITAWPKSADNPYGEVVECLGGTSVNDVEMISILVNQGLDYVFPDAVVREAEKVSTIIDEQEIKERRDFRDITTFTIDPHDAKDFDDAISIKTLENGLLEIGVHIADVSHYVRPGTEMDEEAIKRSNSVYLVDRVVPMLPEQLSNLTCSLRPNEDKFTFSAVFNINSKNEVVSEWFGKTVIHSNKRFTYEEAQEIIEGKDDPLKMEILKLDGIAKALRFERLEAGAMNIESEEVRFKLDDSGHPIDVIIKTSKDAHKLVEEFMLLANKRVAMFVSGPPEKPTKIPFVYRCHDKPDPEKLASFSLFIEKFGLSVDLKNPALISKNINGLLVSLREENEFSLIQSMAIRSMAKAVYETNNIGHYGLGFKEYTHFTSPIRRYADLLVHRILLSKISSSRTIYGSELDELCKRISRMERKAVIAERESTKFFQTLFLSDKIGETFEGTVSGLTEYGLFIKLNDNHCEGFVRLNEIPGDRFSFNKKTFSIIGNNRKEEINLGDPTTVKVLEVNPRKRQIELEIISI